MLCQHDLSKICTICNVKKWYYKIDLALNPWARIVHYTEFFFLVCLGKASVYLDRVSHVCMISLFVSGKDQHTMKFEMDQCSDHIIFTIVWHIHKLLYCCVLK